MFGEKKLKRSWNCVWFFVRLCYEWMVNRLKYWFFLLNIECVCSFGDWVCFKNGICFDYLKKLFGCINENFVGF